MALMNYKMLGRTGIRVSELCLGTMTFGKRTGWGTDEATSRAMFDAFVEVGGNFFDTANSYQEGESEEILGRLIAPERDRHVVATKYSLSSSSAIDPNIRGNHRKNMMRSVEESLRRLGTDFIDLYWVHAWDGLTPEEETLRALDDLVRQGKVLAIGLSDTPAWIAARSQAIAELRGWTSVAAIQFNYSLIEHTADREIVPMADDLGMTMLLWAVLGAGMLTGKYSGSEQAAEGRLTDPLMINDRLTDRNHRITHELARVAKDIGASPSQVALAWARSRSPRMIPLVGARTLAQLEDNLGCLAVTLPDAARAALDAVSSIDLGFPRAFLNGGIARILHGSLRDRIQAPSRL